MMFYRGISHDEAPAEYIWEASDGTQMYASRFALYCRYNWYYQVHRAATRNKVWSKDYNCGEFEYTLFSLISGKVAGDASYDLNFGFKFNNLYIADMDENIKEKTESKINVGAKKIVTLCAEV